MALGSKGGKIGHVVNSAHTTAPFSEPNTQIFWFLVYFELKLEEDHKMSIIGLYNGAFR